MKNFEIIPHTADIGLRVYGRTLKDLFENSASGLLSLSGLKNISPKNSLPPPLGGRMAGGQVRVKSIKFHLSAPNPEELLIRWLNEILYYIQTKNIAVSGVEIIKIEGNKLTAEIEGEVCKGGVKLNREIKAATYHNLEIKKVNSLLQSEIIFDI